MDDPFKTIVEDVEVAIIGGGTCGVICAARCAKLGITYKIIDRQITLGGVWLNYANDHSSLQVISATSVLSFLSVYLF